MVINWDGKILVNGQESDKAIDLEAFTGKKVIIELFPTEKVLDRVPEKVEPVAIPVPVVEPETKTGKQFRVTVKKYMTEKSSPRFDFMEKWNNNNPMPLRIMVGTVEKETRGMVYMHLHGDMYAEVMCTCMRCGRTLTNPVSQYFGIGPECGGHNYVNPFEDDAQLKEAVAEYRIQLLKMEWTGWVIKSAITNWEEVTE